MKRLKHIAVALPLLLIVSAASREANEEWAARQVVEANNRAMFSCQPMVEPSTGDSSYLIHPPEKQIQAA